MITSIFKSLYFLKWCPIFDTSPLTQFSKINNFLWVCWFLAKNLSNFLPLSLKLDNPNYHRGHLVIKSTSFKVLPVSLSEVFQLECNLKFSSVQAFSKVKDILSVCLASLTPLSVPQIYAAVNALQVNYYQKIAILLL